jgi:hypothetical protein
MASIMEKIHSDSMRQGDQLIGSLNALIQLQTMKLAAAAAAETSSSKEKERDPESTK